MKAAENDITIEQGADYSFVMEIKDNLGVVYDLSSGTASDFRGHLRKESGKKLEAGFTTSFLTDGTDGKVVFTISDTDTFELDVRHPLKYDIFWDRPSGLVDKLVYGDATVVRNITT